MLQALFSALFCGVSTEDKCEDHVCNLGGVPCPSLRRAFMLLGRPDERFVGAGRGPQRLGGHNTKPTFESTSPRAIGPKVLLSRLWNGSSPDVENIAVSTVAIAEQSQLHRPSTHTCPFGTSIHGSGYGGSVGTCNLENEFY